MCKCKVCNKTPFELDEWETQCKYEEMEFTEENATKLCKDMEGTYNYETDLFYCTPCYIAIGMPLGTA